tara:strand:- start:2776 stop:3003 length:228 start_codon:yes stop_codon:yes gene_type:complete
MIDGYDSFYRHRKCLPFQGHAQAENIPGTVAIRMWLPCADESMIQMVMPHDAIRKAWMADWDRARAEFLEAEEND